MKYKVESLSDEHAHNVVKVHQEETELEIRNLKNGVVLLSMKGKVSIDGCEHETGPAVLLPISLLKVLIGDL